jgi:hypothetical protein
MDIGDRVRVNRELDRNHGLTGTVIKIDGDDAQIEMDSQFFTNKKGETYKRINWFFLHHLVKIDD